MFPYAYNIMYLVLTWNISMYWVGVIFWVHCDYILFGPGGVDSVKILCIQIFYVELITSVSYLLEPIWAFAHLIEHGSFVCLYLGLGSECCTLIGTLTMCLSVPVLWNTCFIDSVGYYCDGCVPGVIFTPSDAIYWRRIWICVSMVWFDSNSMAWDFSISPIYVLWSVKLMFMVSRKIWYCLLEVSLLCCSVL